MASGKYVLARRSTFSGRQTCGANSHTGRACMQPGRICHRGHQAGGLSRHRVLVERHAPAVFKGHSCSANLRCLLQVWYASMLCVCLPSDMRYVNPFTARLGSTAIGICTKEGAAAPAWKFCSSAFKEPGL